MGYHTFSHNEGVVDPSEAKNNSIIIFDNVACEKQDNIREDNKITFNDIIDFIYNKLKDYNLENTFKNQSNNNTLQVEITTMRESVYFTKYTSDFLF